MRVCTLVQIDLEVTDHINHTLTLSNLILKVGHYPKPVIYATFSSDAP